MELFKTITQVEDSCPQLTCCMVLQYTMKKIKAKNLEMTFLSFLSAQGMTNGDGTLQPAAYPTIPYPGIGEYPKLFVVCPFLDECSNMTILTP